ncbi:MAG: class I SAM-dependent methyltransferase [Betaproteobacteria bacterium]|nr:class I SAM-dependent methyltransferase [Betaproteobacteria bacterium]
MSIENAISKHYTHGDLLGAIQVAIPKLGKTVDSITVEDLGPVDEFHIGGRLATDHLLQQMKFTDKDHVLDVGCGLGGAARYTAKKTNARVTGIDLTQEYIDTGNALCSWVGLERQVTLEQGSALSMPFEDESFDGAIMLHVGMNIADKKKLFAEVYRVLRPGAVFGAYDIMQIGDGEANYPATWATDRMTSSLATPDQYRQALGAAGFVITAETNRREFGLEFFKQMKAKTEANGGPPPLGLHTLMQATTPAKIKNLVENVSAGLLAPVEMIARKPA